MATISKRKIYIDAEHNDFVQTINYSGGYFRIKIPPFMAERLVITDKNPELKADSEGAVEKSFEALIKEYNEVNRSESKVILFSMKLQGVIEHPDHPGFHRADHNRDFFLLYRDEISSFNFGNSSARGLLMSWGVYNKIFYKGKIDYKKISGDYFDYHVLRYIDDEKGVKELPWTVEREVAFATLQSKIEELLLSIENKIMKLDTKGLQNLIDSQGKNLLT